MTRASKAHLICSAFAVGFLSVSSPLRAESAPAQPANVPTSPYVALPPDLDRLLRDYERAWRAGDAAALAALFSEDGFVLQSNRAPVRGRAAIEAAYAGQGASALWLKPLAFSADNATGSIVGVYGFGDSARDVGKFTLTLRRTPGQPWLIFSDMDNLNAPPRSP